MVTATIIVEVKALVTSVSFKTVDMSAGSHHPSLGLQGHRAIVSHCVSAPISVGMLDAGVPVISLLNSHRFIVFNWEVS